MRANLHQNSPFGGSNLSWRLTQASGMPVILSWSMIILTIKHDRCGKRTPRSVRIKFLLPSATKNVNLFKKWQPTWHSETLHTFCGKQQYRQSFWQTTNPSHHFSRQMQFHQRCGTHVILCLQFIFKIAQVTGSVDRAAEFLSRLKVTKKKRLKIREDILTAIIEVTTSSSDVADEEQFFFTHADNENESEGQTL